MSLSGVALSWSTDNAKVSKKADAVSFGLPAFRAEDGFTTCPGAAACAGFCYARQGRYVMPNARLARERNLTAARSPAFRYFLAWDLAALSRKGIKLIRIHDSGDFFSQKYLDAWISAAKKFPGITFYAYTKSLHLDFSAMPENFVVTASMGGKFDADIGTSGLGVARVFPTHAARKRAGYGDGTNTDTLAINGKKRIGLVYHGPNKLTPAKRRAMERMAS